MGNLFFAWITKEGVKIIMKDYYGICWNCKRNFIKSRIDQLFCSNKCRRKYNYIPVPQCKNCSSNHCMIRNEKKKYAPKECPER